MARNSARPKPAQSGSTRCAIYTRKSSEDGLEQEFNSLDAQREACLAYITSQRREGWKALPTHYNDGGFSGGTLNRLAVQRLARSVAAASSPSARTAGEAPVAIAVSRVRSAASRWRTLVQRRSQRFSIAGCGWLPSGARSIEMRSYRL